MEIGEVLDFQGTLHERMSHERMSHNKKQEQEIIWSTDIQGGKPIIPTDSSTPSNHI